MQRNRNDDVFTIFNHLNFIRLFISLLSIYFILMNKSKQDQQVCNIIVSLLLISLVTNTLNRVFLETKPSFIIILNKYELLLWCLTCQTSHSSLINLLAIFSTSISIVNALFTCMLFTLFTCCQ